LKKIVNKDDEVIFIHPIMLAGDNKIKDLVF